MIKVFFIFFLLLTSVWLGIQLQHDPGYLLIAVNQWTLETTVWVAALVLILIFCTLHIILLLFTWLVGIPLTWKNWLTKRRTQKAQAKTRRGLIEFSEGYWLQAKNNLINALPDTDTPLFNYLTAARAAQEMGDNKLRDDYLRQAQQLMPEAQIAVELTQAQLQIANRQWEQALATLKHLQSLAPHHPYVLKLLMNLYEEIKDWPHLIAMLPELKRYRVVSSDKFKELQHHIYLQAVIELIRQNQRVALKELIASLPKNLSYDPTLMEKYCLYLLQVHEEQTAEAILRRCITKKFNERLMALYGKITIEHDQPLRFAESLLKQHPHSAVLFLSLGRLCRTQNLWGKAHTYFEESIKHTPCAAAYAELGQLLDLLEDPLAAGQAYRQGLLLITEHEDCTF